MTHADFDNKMYMNKPVRPAMKFEDLKTSDEMKEISKKLVYNDWHDVNINDAMLDLALVYSGSDGKEVKRLNESLRGEESQDYAYELASNKREMILTALRNKVCDNVYYMVIDAIASTIDRVCSDPYMLPVADSARKTLRDYMYSDQTISDIRFRCDHIIDTNIIFSHEYTGNGSDGKNLLGSLVYKMNSTLSLIFSTVSCRLTTALAIVLPRDKSNVENVSNVCGDAMEHLNNKFMVIQTTTKSNIKTIVSAYPYYKNSFYIG